MTTSAPTSLTKPKVYESKTIQLTSPMLHIGSEVSKLNPFEYVQTASKVYLPNQEALAQALRKQGGRFLQDYIEAIENQRPIKSLLEQIVVVVVFAHNQVERSAIRTSQTPQV